MLNFVTVLSNAYVLSRYTEISGFVYARLLLILSGLSAFLIWSVDASVLRDIIFMDVGIQIILFICFCGFTQSRREFLSPYIMMNFVYFFSLILMPFLMPERLSIVACFAVVVSICFLGFELRARVDSY